MSWTVEEEKKTARLTIKYAGNVVKEVEVSRPEAAVKIVKEVAAEKGLKRFDVLVNGETVDPAEFAELVEDAIESGGTIEAEIVKKDVAA